MKIVHLCLSSFYIDDYSYQENMLPKYHVLKGHDVTVIASLVSFDASGKPCLLDSESTKITKDGYKVIRVDYKRPFFNFNKFVRIYNSIYFLKNIFHEDNEFTPRMFYFANRVMCINKPLYLYSITQTP